MSVTLTQKKTDPQIQEATIGQDPDDISNGSQDIYIDPAAEKRALLKCDLFLVPLLTAAFLLAYLDRSNIGNAAIAGLPEDLGMSSQQLASKLPILADGHRPLLTPQTRCYLILLRYLRAF